MERLSSLVNESRILGGSWNSWVPIPIRPAAGKLCLSPLISMTSQYNLGWRGRLQQLPLGFNLTGAWRHSFTFPIIEKSTNPNPISLNKKSHSVARRLHEGGSKSGFRNDKLLWKGSSGRRKKGWLSAPLPLARAKWGACRSITHGAGYRFSLWRCASC